MLIKQNVIPYQEMPVLKRIALGSELYTRPYICIELYHAKSK